MFVAPPFLYGVNTGSSSRRHLKMIRSPREYVQFFEAGRFWQAEADFAATLRRCLIPNLATKSFTFERRSRGFAILETAVGRVFVKKHRRRQPYPSAVLNYLLKRTRARREWVNHRKAVNLGVPAPLPLAFSEALGFSLRYSAYIIVEAFEPSWLSLRAWRKVAPDKQAEYLAVEKVARCLGQLHEKGIFHLDFTEMNVWGSVCAGTWEPVHIIDFEKCRFASSTDDVLARRSMERARNKLPEKYLQTFFEGYYAARNISPKEAMKRGFFFPPDQMCVFATECSYGSSTAVKYPDCCYCRQNYLQYTFSMKKRRTF